MKILLLVALSASAVAQDRPATPSACGSKSAIYETALDATHHDSMHGEHGKALVYLIQDDGSGGNHQHYTLRVGLDGKWVGAYKNNSYFAVSLDAGEHHLCADVQSNSGASNIALAHFTAEEGKVYYFRTRFLAGLSTQYPVYPFLELDQPDSDEANYLMALYPLSVFHLRK